MSEEVFSLYSGSGPLVLSLPHVGTHIPPPLAEAYTPRALQREDTDWHLDRLYGFVREMNVTMLVPHVSRYVIDLNRPPDNAPMYPGASNTELCPTRFFTGDPLYRDGMKPDDRETERRRITYWQPYHDALRMQLERVRNQFGYALLWDGHSIRSEVPWLFDGTLPDLNLGTVSGESCDHQLISKLTAILRGASEFTNAIDGRFKGGYITRHYGRPNEGIHAVQMEMCQSLYMNENPPFDYVETKAHRVQPLLAKLIRTMIDWKPRASR
jgi:N-formylglutamate deformylase